MADNDINVGLGIKDDYSGELASFRNQTKKSSNFFQQSMSTAVGVVAAQLSLKLAAAVTAAIYLPSKLAQSVIAFRSKLSAAASAEEKQLVGLAGVIQSTGGAAGYTAKEMEKMANMMRKATTFSSAQVMEAEKMLLTFTNIGHDTFPQALAVTLDMTEMFGSLESASIQLGKALNDPILGVSALREKGVNFNQSQMDVIKALVKTGKTAEAQQLIIKELNTEFGGQAALAAKTFEGSEQRKQNAWEHTYAIAGRFINDAMKPLNIEMAKIADSKGTVEFFKNLGKALAAPAAGLTEMFRKTRIAFDFIAEVKKLNKEGKLGEDDFNATIDATLDYVRGNVKLLFREVAEVMWDNLKPVVDRMMDMMKMGLATVFDSIPGLGSAAQSLREGAAEYQARARVKGSAYENEGFDRPPGMSEGDFRVFGQQTGQMIAELQIMNKNGKYYDQYLAELAAIRGTGENANKQRDADRNTKYDDERASLLSVFKTELAPILENNPALDNLVKQFTKKMEETQPKRGEVGEETPALKSANTFKTAVETFDKAVDKMYYQTASTGGQSIYDRYNRRADEARAKGNEDEANRLQGIAMNAVTPESVKRKRREESGNGGGGTDDVGAAADEVVSSIKELKNTMTNGFMSMKDEVLSLNDVMKAYVWE